MENVNKQMFSTVSTHSYFQNWIYYGLFSVLCLYFSTSTLFILVLMWYDLLLLF